MEEKRRAKRLKVMLNLNVSSLFKQDDSIITNIDSPIEVVDISKKGIGFISKSNLPVGYYFNAALQLGHSENTLYCVVKIVRCVPQDDDIFIYGCEFIGLAPVLGFIFDDYEKELNESDS